MANFKVHARVLDLLGFEQIADMPTAASELFKNAYDAYADNVVLELFRHQQHAILWDDGVGMSQDDIENRWLVVGTPSKKLAPPPVRDGYERRPVMGEKGIGRLAVSTLGDTLLLISKKDTGKPDCFTALFLNWKVARNPKLMLDEFEVPVLPFSSLDDFTSDIFGMLVDEFRNQLKATSAAGRWNGHEELLEQIRSDVDSFNPDLSLFQRTGSLSGKSGTAFYIGSLTSEIQCLTKSKDRHDTTDKSVYDQIVLLLSNFNKSRIASDIRPSSKSKKAFYADVRLWGESLDAPLSLFEGVDIFQPDDLERFDHYFDIQFDADGRYTGTILRYGEPLDLPTPEQQPVVRSLKCGAFGLRFWYWQGVEKESILPPDAWQRINKKLKYSGGVMVYRDGLRVLPYGIPENDWLSIEERRSKHAGYYFFSYRRMFGYVTIDAENNPLLRDKAGREGMIKNAAYRDLRSILEAFFQQIAALYFRDNQEFREKQSQIQAKNSVLEGHKNTLKKKREELLKQLEDSLSKLEKQRARLLDLKGEMIKKLSDSNLSESEMTKAVSSFEERIQQLLGEIKVVIPKSLSLGREQKLNQAAYDYEEGFNSLKSEADSVREAILDKVEKDCPAIEQRVARRRLLENALKTEKMRVGRTFKPLNDLVEKQTSELSAQVESARENALKMVENALLEVSNASSIEDALDKDSDIDDAIRKMVAAADSGEDSCNEWLERVSNSFGNALDEDDALVLSIQDERIEELEKKIQETVELAQIGLSVEMIHHDLNNMYRGIAGSIRTLRHMLSKSPEAMAQMNSLQSSFQHLELRYRQLEPLYRASYRVKKAITGQDVVKFVRQFLEHDLEVAGVSLEPTHRFLEFKVVEARSLILPAFVNLVDNAIYWLRSGDRRVIRFDVVHDAVVVNDSGTGIHETMLERIFEAFTTTKPDGRGLGLYIAKQSLALANHEIWATNDVAYKTETGACFCLKFSEKARGEGKEGGDE